MLSELKKGIEEDAMEKVFEIYIKTTPERLWEAITNPEMRAKYTFGINIRSDWGPGSSYTGMAGNPPTSILEARTWKSIRPDAWFRASERCGATM